MSLVQSRLLTRCSTQLFKKRSTVVSAFTLTLISAAPSISKSHCDGGSGDDDQDWIKSLQAMGDNLASVAGEKLQVAVDSGVPTQVSYGFVCGFCSGYALKKAGKVAGGVLGLGFMSLQSLSYLGYIKVDHVRMKEDFDSFLDLNKDGTINGDDAKLGYTKALDVFAFNLPGGSGFGAGFLGGLRSG